MSISDNVGEWQMKKYIGLAVERNCEDCKHFNRLCGYCQKKKIDRYEKSRACDGFDEKEELE